MAGQDVEYVFVTNKAGLEDIDFGYGTTQQIRDGEIVEITKVNAHNIPYTGTGNYATIGEALDYLLSQGANNG